ncbi:MAG: cysteine hydrolase [Agriterribacter sp.]
MEQITKHTALLVLDMQEQLLNSLSNATPLVQEVSKAIEHARKNNIPVIYAVVGFKKGFPEVSSDNKSFARNMAHLAHVDMEQWMKVHPDIMPVADEPIVIKKRFSAFTGSDLELILRSKKINHLVLCGVVSSGVVLSTVVEAADKDYIMTILSDGCIDRDDEVHKVLMEKIFQRYASVVTVNDWTKA